MLDQVVPENELIPIDKKQVALKERFNYICKLYFVLHEYDHLQAHFGTNMWT